MILLLLLKGLVADDIGVGPFISACLGYLEDQENIWLFHQIPDSFARNRLFSLISHLFRKFTTML